MHRIPEVYRLRTHWLKHYHFKDRYCLDFYDGLEYFETIEAAAEFIGERIGKTLKPDFAEIEKEIDDCLEEHDDDEECWMSFHEYEVLDD